MLRQGIRDCDELPKRDRSEFLTQEAPHEPGTHQGHKRRCVQVWQAPDWVHELARSRDFDGELEQESTQQNISQHVAARADEELLPQVVTQDGMGHNLCVYEVTDAQALAKGRLVGCTLCGAYSH
eukprot:4944293-Amphidinium_carterae.1